jgi:negative regulator of flagellin synthesis FlgM
MKVYGSLDPLRPDRANGGVSPTPRHGDGPAQPVQPVSPTAARSDSVEISDRGRSMAGRADAVDPERVAELRRKVYEGAYNSLDVVDQVARRILTRGDL